MKKVLSLLSLCLITFVSISQAQQPPQKQEQVDDVVRTTTELVQTDVLVFDRQGRFVDGLKREQFELRVDGKAQPVSFFEQVAAGSAREEALRTTQGAQTEALSKMSQMVERGRTVIFFVDDLHLSLDSMERTRRALRYFIEKEMRVDDQVAVVAASGNIGFLGQFTENKAVLRAAISRLSQVPYTVRDSDKPPMTEYIAIKIEHGDTEVIEFYVEELLKGFVTRGGNRATNRNAVKETVKNRARQIVIGVEAVTTNTLASLESLMRSSSEIPGRKLVFFISDGFYLDPKRTGSAATNQLKRVTDAATRAGVVVYTIDARGLVSGQIDATNDRPIDPTGRVDRANVGEITLSQDGLNALADDTGGRATRNRSAIDDWVKNVLQETSNYYVLAWRPQSEEQKDMKYKNIEVKVVGRPELSVRLPRGFFMNEGLAVSAKGNDSKTSATTSQAAAPKTPEGEIRNALTGFAPKRNLRTRVATTFLDVPNSGLVLTASTQLATDALSYGADGKQKASVDLAGVVLNDKGKPVTSFKTRLNVDPSSNTAGGSNSSAVIYNYKAPLQPGIYQVRVAARDAGNGRVGSAMQWIEIPDLSSRRLSLSSLIVGGMAGSSEKNAGTIAGHAPQFQPSVDRRFLRTSHLSFWIFIYNAARGGGGGGAPDLSAQVQVLRAGQRIISTPQRKLNTDGMTDMARIPYGGDFALSSLQPGRYVLQVNITDRVAGMTASERISFEVE
jgi:VWFA-related protein